MDDSKSKNSSEVPENTGTQQAAEEIPATVTDGSSRYGTPDDLTRNIQTLTVSQDKGFTFIIDKGDEVQSEFVSNPGSALARQIREVIVPNFDRYCFGVMADSAKNNGHYDSTAATASNAYELLLKGIEHMSDRNVPTESVICFCTYKYWRK